jgi:outer membrane protein insertion porin family
MKWAARAALCGCLLLPGAAAQKHPSGSKASPASPYKLIAFNVTGTARYSDKEVLAASGLQLGQNASDGDFKEAVQRLGNSGIFGNAAYSYSASSTGTKLELQVTDVESSKLVPAHFENFVWFTDDQLHAAVQRSAPLFKDLLPIGGNLSEHVDEALQALLSEKQLPGRVNFLREANGPDGALSAINYRVEEVSIRIRGVEFPGASPQQGALLEKVSSNLTGAEYGRTPLAAVAKHDLLPVLLQRGYLKAAFAASDARVLPQSSAPPDAQGPAELEVDAILPVTPGKQYLTSGVEVNGNSSISADKIAPLLHLKPGEPADAVRLIRDLDNVSKLYRSRGYMTVQVKPDTGFDEDKGTVHYVVHVTEGDLYKMGEVEILGLDTQAQARLQEAWTLHEGQPYNADYPRKFLEDTRNLVPRGVQWDVSLHETPDAKDRTVDVEIRFKQL